MKLYRSDLFRSHFIPWTYDPMFCSLRTSCQISLFCKLHPLCHPLHSCPCPSSSLSSFFLLCFILSPLPPSHFWWVFNCSFVIVGDSVQLLLHHDEFGDCIFLLSVRHYCIVCVRASWYGSFRTRGLQYRSYHGWCLSHYRIVCMNYSSTRPIVQYFPYTRYTVLKYCS